MDHWELVRMLVSQLQETSLTSLALRNLNITAFMEVSLAWTKILMLFTPGPSRIDTWGSVDVVFYQLDWVLLRENNTWSRIDYCAIKTIWWSKMWNLYFDLTGVWSKKNGWPIISTKDYLFLSIYGQSIHCKWLNKNILVIYGSYIFNNLITQILQFDCI